MQVLARRASLRPLDFRRLEYPASGPEDNKFVIIKNNGDEVEVGERPKRPWPGCWLKGVLMDIVDIRGKNSMLPSNPWTLLFNAFLYLVFGFMLVCWPGSTLKVLYTIFGIFAICYGLFVLGGVFISRPPRTEEKSAEKEKALKKEGGGEEKARPDWLMVPIALAALIAGIIALAWPSATSTVILVILGIWAISTGVIETAAGMRLPKGFKGKALILATALVSIGFGIYFIVGPERKGANEIADTVVIIVGIFGIAKGVLIAAYSFLLRGLYRDLEKA